MGLDVISPPIAFVSPVRTLNTPFGQPARSANSANASGEKGGSPAGLTTTVQPAARAGATLRVIMAMGKFHGVIATQTPIGSLITTRRLSFCGWGIVPP